MPARRERATIDPRGPRCCRVASCPRFNETSALSAGSSHTGFLVISKRDVPAVKPYCYAMTQDKVLIVNPADHKIADVVAPSK
jgi:hypothetical protein